MRTELPAGNHDFRSVLTDVAMKALGISRIEAEPFADANLTKYWNWLNKEMDEHRRRGIIPYFDTPSAAARTIACECLRLQSSTVLREREQGALARARAVVFQQVEDLTDREYEALACVTCRAMGASNVQLTPPGGEGGIDFLATFRVDTRSHIFSGVGRDVRVVGQCKKYESPVSIEKIDQFLTTMLNVRSRSERVRRHIPAWFDDASGPILGWIISHNGFQQGSSDEAKKNGIVLSDSLDIVEALSLSDKILPTAPPSGRASFVRSECVLLLT